MIYASKANGNEVMPKLIDVVSLVMICGLFLLTRSALSGSSYAFTDFHVYLWALAPVIVIFSLQYVPWFSRKVRLETIVLQWLVTLIVLLIGQIDNSILQWQIDTLEAFKDSNKTFVIYLSGIYAGIGALAVLLLRLGNERLQILMNTILIWVTIASTM